MTPQNNTHVYVAEKLVASSPEAQIFGAALFGLIQNLNADQIKPILTEFHLENIDPDIWYPQQTILNVYKAIINSQLNSTENLVAIGIKLIDSAPVNPAENTVESAIKALDAMVRQVERNVPDNENFVVVESRPGYALVIANMPFPDHLLYGYLWGITRRYKPAGSKFSVRIIQNANPQEYPGTAFEITWG